MRVLVVASSSLVKSHSFTPRIGTTFLQLSFFPGMDRSTSSSGLSPPSSHQVSDHAAVCGQGLVLPACGWQIIQKTDLYNNTSHLHSAWKLEVLTTFCRFVYECSWLISTLLCHVDTKVLTHAFPWGIGYHYHC